MNWIKRRGTTAKRTMNPALYDELTFTWKKKIAEKVFEHKIHNDLILNFDFFFFFFNLLYLESGFLSVAYLTVANLARLGISVHC